MTFYLKISGTYSPAGRRHYLMWREWSDNRGTRYRVKREGRETILWAYPQVADGDPPPARWQNPPPDPSMAAAWAIIASCFGLGILAGIFLGRTW